MSTLQGRVLDELETWRRPIVVGVHIVLICLSNYVAFLLRFDGEIPDPQAPLVVQMLPWLVAVRALVFVPFRLYEGMWRYASIWDLRNIIAAVGLSSVLFYILVHYGFGETAYSRSIFFIDSILLICFMGGLRLSKVVSRDWTARRAPACAHLRRWRRGRDDCPRDAPERDLRV